MKGLEPPRLSAPDPKSGAATNYATAAGGFWFCDCKDITFFWLHKLLLQESSKSQITELFKITSSDPLFHQ